MTVFNDLVRQYQLTLQLRSLIRSNKKISNAIRLIFRLYKFRLFFFFKSNFRFTAQLRGKRSSHIPGTVYHHWQHP